MTAENGEVSVSEKGYGLALSGEEGVSSCKKRLHLVLGGNASKAITFHPSNDLAPFIAEGSGCWKSGPVKRGWLCVIVQLINIVLLELRKIFILAALQNDSTDCHSDFRSSPQALSFSVSNSHLKRDDRIKL